MTKLLLAVSQVSRLGARPYKCDGFIRIKQLYRGTGLEAYHYPVPSAYESLRWMSCLIVAAGALVWSKAVNDHAIAVDDVNAGMAGSALDLLMRAL